MNLKKLLELRNDKVVALQAMMNKAKTEERAMTTEEMTSFETLEGEIAALDKTIKAEERARTRSGANQGCTHHRSAN